MTCSICRHGVPPKEPAMAGSVQCKLEHAPWHYLRPGQACLFNPPRWVAA